MSMGKWLVSLGLALLGLAPILTAPVPVCGAPAAATCVEVRNYPTPEQRAVTFESTRNTRDLGGLPAGGRWIRKHMIYRSGAFCYATPADQQKLAHMGLKTIIDLRSRREVDVKEGPDRLPEGCPTTIEYLPMVFKGDTKIGRYYSYALDNDASVQGFFAALARRDTYPVLFHCSAGKDRTGVMAALLLELLGVKRSIIMDDYLQSRRNSAKLEVHEEWLGEIFSLIDKAGGVRRFLQAQGVDAEDLDVIPSILLQDGQPL